jgi:ATP-binding cassette subfamily B protein
LPIFDEATSALDSLTEEDITNTIRDISTSRDQISLLIAHRLSTIMHADVIYVLEQGKIVETGSHESLLDQKGLYYAMWRQQVGERRNPVNRPLSEPAGISTRKTGTESISDSVFAGETDEHSQ